jgi:hypothetical protein
MTIVQPAFASMGDELHVRYAVVLRWRLFVGLAFLVVLPGLFELLSRDPTPPIPGFVLWNLAAVLVVWLLMTAFLVLSRTRLVVGPAGVHERNLLRMRPFEWREIRHVRIDADGLYFEFHDPEAMLVRLSGTMRRFVERGPSCDGFKELAVPRIYVGEQGPERIANWIDRVRTS